MHACFRKRTFKLTGPSFDSLSRTGVDEIERVSIEYGACDVHSIESLARGMQTAKLPKRGIVQCLQADGDAIDAGEPVPAEATRFDTGWIAFERYLHIR